MLINARLFGSYLTNIYVREISQLIIKLSQIFSLPHSRLFEVSLP